MVAIQLIIIAIVLLQIATKVESSASCSKYSTDGWHSGTHLEQLDPSLSPNGIQWEWYECAEECARYDGCEYWTLRLTSDQNCLLMANQGEYHDDVNHVEGSKDTGCMYYKPVCIDTNAAGVTLSFQGSNLISNNLGGQGPNNDDEPVIHISNVGWYRGQTLDLVVSVKEGYSYEKDGNNIYRCEATFNADCVTGDFFQIVQKPGNEVVLNMEIIDHSTREPVLLPALKLGVFDFDGPMGNPEVEEFAVRGYKYSMFYNGEHKEASFEENVLGVRDFCDEAINNGYNCLVAKSTEGGPGGSCDNPWDSENVGVVTCDGMQVDQLARSFQVDFEYTSSFELYMRLDSSPSNGRGYLLMLGPTKWDEHCGEEIRPELLPFDMLGMMGPRPFGR